MKKIYTYHVHSTYSDGKSFIEDYVTKASELKIEILGFSDHLVISPYTSEIIWSMNLSKLEEYYKEIKFYCNKFSNQQITNELNSLNNRVDICIGLEVDYFDHEYTLSYLKNIFSTYQFDFIIGSMHYIDDIPIELPFEDWNSLSKRRIEELLIRYWQNVVKLAESKLFDIVAHIDYPKQFLPKVDINLNSYIHNALGAIKDNNLILEINTKGLDSTHKEIYPSFAILKTAYQMEIPIMINPDAHDIYQLTRHYDYAYKLVKDLGFTKITTIKHRKKNTHNIIDIL